MKQLRKKIAKIYVERLIWDSWNSKHINKHKVILAEIEDACHHHLLVLETYEKRLIILGKTEKDRLLAIVLVRKINQSYYVVTARDMSKKERKLISNVRK
ncbi:MAG: hypothetical protein PVJ09_02255 [Candidatus Woesebacteria bacterium]|jgi:uncharacterized DUF497 family protein